MTKHDYAQFYDRYIFGTEVPDYDKIFGYAGYRLEKKPQAAPDFGFSVRSRNGGFMINRIEPNGSAAKAGLKEGDLITKIDRVDPFSAQLGNMAGKTVKLAVKHADGTESEMPMTVGSRSVVSWNMVTVSDPSKQQTRIRDAWLRKSS